MPDTRDAVDQRAKRRRLNDDGHWSRIQAEGDLQLLLADGTIVKASGFILSYASLLFDDLLQLKKPQPLPVEFTKAAWEVLLLRLYPTCPRPQLSLVGGLRYWPQSRAQL